MQQWSTLQKKQKRFQVLRQWVGMAGDVAMQHQLATECDGIVLEFDKLLRGIGQFPEKPEPSS
jgi:hypothetical protein